jgi:hypothetical protein
MKASFSGFISRGKMAVHDKKGLSDFVSAIDNMDVVLTIEKKKRRRSLSQNSYYFSVVVPMIRSRFIELGHDVNMSETHEFLKARFNKVDIINEHTGEVFSFPRSTSDLTTVEFMAYIERVLLFASETLEITIPSPNTQTELF